MTTTTHNHPLPTLRIQIAILFRYSLVAWLIGFGGLVRGQVVLDREIFGKEVFQVARQTAEEESCQVHFACTHAPLRLDRHALVEFQFQDTRQLNTLRLQRSSGVGPFLSPTSILGNKVVFDQLVLDETYVLTGWDYCGRMYEIDKVSTAAPSNATDPSTASEDLFEAITEYHQQRTDNFTNIVDFLLDYPGLSRHEVLSYLQIFLRKGEPIDRSVLNPKTKVSFQSFSILHRGPLDTNQGPDDPETMNGDSTYCVCRIVQTMSNILAPGRKKDFISNDYEPETLVRQSTLLNLHERTHYLTAIGPAKTAVNLAQGKFQAERKNIQLSTVNPSNPIPLYATLRYLLNCTDNRGSQAAMQLCDCERMGHLNWSYDVAFKTNAATIWDPFVRSYANGYMMDMAYVIRLENNRSPVVLDVGLADMGAACGGSNPGAQIDRIALIRESMGLAILQNISSRSEAAAFQTEWANSATQIRDQISTLLTTRTNVSPCGGEANISRRLMDSDFVGNRSRFSLRMGREVKIILASAVHSSISMRGHSGIYLAANSAFKLAGWVTGGNPIDITNPNNPQNRENCCGRYIGNYILVSYQDENVPINPPITELNMRRLLGEFYGSGFWETFEEGTIVPIDPGEGILVLPPGNIFRMISRPEFSPVCLYPFIFRPRSSNGPTETEGSDINHQIHSWETYLNAIEQGSLNQGRLTIYSMDGKFIHQVQDIRVETVRYAVQQQPSGMYLLQHQTPNQIITFKMIKL